MITTITVHGDIPLHLQQHLMMTGVAAVLLQCSWNISRLEEFSIGFSEGIEARLEFIDLSEWLSPTLLFIVASEVSSTS